ncbi:hypothetical protein NNC19_10030 [Clostridium sp. SHJSY1]|uniref:hypothetical protein n=1 Tax=Clostridium sp. SHJSY1 TaxID=2942483 RepID=UPI0028762F19|nr:hypothetical protein [Clostridium sp. SHJSY1]MDS0526017.1 hypothetical protein [Clostridium sp. SHJSY1]
MKKKRIIISCVAIASIMSSTSCLTFATTIPSSTLSITDTLSVTENSKTVEANTTWTIDKTTKLQKLIIGEGSSIAAPERYDVTLSVNGVGKAIEKGTYRGDIVLSVTKQNVVKYSPSLTHYFKQALYVDSTGIVSDKSVKAEVVGGNVTNTSADNINIKSEEEKFNAIYVPGGTYSINDSRLSLIGNGGNDFAGYGAGIMSTGKNTTVVVNNTNIDTHGAIRTAVVADAGSNMIVKNSNISAKDGVLPSDYKANVQPGLMKSAPWMLGISGNCRATNVLGENTKATYINSSVSAEGWGALSVDACKNVKLTAINSKIAVTGKSGYGAYAIGDSIDSFYGCKINVPDYGLIVTGGTGNFGASTSEKLNTLNSDLSLGLTSGELKSLQETQTTVKSNRFGVMWHGNGTVNIKDGTVFETGETSFLIKGAAANINMDGSKGAHVKSASGVILQLMDNDDPGAVMSDGVMYNTGVYKEPTGDATLDESHDTTIVTKDTDTIANFSNTILKGDFYNSTRGGTATDFMGNKKNLAKNLSLNFDKTKINGVISASNSKHAKDTITSEDYEELGEVTNAVSSAVNNGVIVSLTNGSNWTVTGKSCLTSLTIDNDSKITTPNGYKVTMKIDGNETEIKAGTYKGNIVITIDKTAE